LSAKPLSGGAIFDEFASASHYSRTTDVMLGIHGIKALKGL